ncbi:tRNA-dihydrouridine synthase family protein [Mediterraneibacter sp. NSJ-55]|uniref:tRNA-dihydrouridine synthase n=1 Tax=Mediterraneibacter hominis TaxID=2763054 RepID=A0A923RPG8_9FIRM|nr:tRNA-dihydrouridine synthase family protein [Mediterraneibacter hominis]MBC5688499.1 tRNA-dihydrouridine synthase family protein [Mediterraneibacter hominis]
MQFYLAPLEGITGYIFRNAVHDCFGGFDKYFIPFISPNQKGHFSAREKQDLLPEHNEGMYAVPQILTNSAEDFLSTAKRLAEYGYEEVNLNLGCPSRTVVTKGRGAGFLGFPEKLQQFLERIFCSCPLKISIKTRLGVETSEEFAELLKIYNQYPMEELIIHPRVQRDFYRNKPDIAAFEKAWTERQNKICYNGDVFTKEDVRRIRKQFPELECMMCGRGILMNPSLMREVQGGKYLDKEELRQFHDQIYTNYQEVLFGEKTVLFKMKELWTYLAPLFTDSKKYAKKIKKSVYFHAYEEAVEALFTEQEIRRQIQ